MEKQVYQPVLGFASAAAFAACRLKTFADASTGLHSE